MRPSSLLAQRWGTVLAAVLLVAGLFALHVLSHHGEHVPSVSASAAPVAGHGEHGSSGQAPGDDHHDGSGVMTLCLAMLAGAAVWLLAQAVRRRSARSLVLLPRWAAGGVLLTAGRAHSPPGRWAFSVCRC